MNCPHYKVQVFTNAHVWPLGIGVCVECAVVVHVETLEKVRKQFTPDGDYELVAPPKEGG